MPRKRKPKSVKVVTKVNIQFDNDLVPPNRILQMNEDSAEIFLHKGYVVRYESWPEQWRDRLNEWPPLEEQGESENGADN